MTGAWRVGLILAFAGSAFCEWVRPEAGKPLVWGRTDGVVFGIPSEGGMPGPRGLIRVGIWNRATGKPELINFVAVEPVTEGAGARQSRMGFSELEPSRMDAPQRGKRLWVDAAAGELATVPARPRPVERLSVRIEVEPFTANGAHVYVIATMESDRPGEISFSVHHHEDSAPIDELTLTATMGNYERLRQLWLKDRIVLSREVYAGFSGNGFIDRENYPLEEMLRVGDGDAIALCTNDEPDPAAVSVARPWWTYHSVKLTQYWRVPARQIQPDLRVKVNGRRVYWASDLEVPGGVAFENFEVRERYVPGQVFVFGLTPKQPWEFEPRISRLANPR